MSLLFWMGWCPATSSCEHWPLDPPHLPHRRDSLMYHCSTEPHWAGQKPVHIMRSQHCFISLVFLEFIFSSKNFFEHGSKSKTKQEGTLRSVAFLYPHSPPSPLAHALTEFLFILFHYVHMNILKTLFLIQKIELMVLHLAFFSLNNIL